jgi:hypothetical protein
MDVRWGGDLMPRYNDSIVRFSTQLALPFETWVRSPLIVLRENEAILVKCVVIKSEELFAVD